MEIARAVVIEVIETVVVAVAVSIVVLVVAGLVGAAAVKKISRNRSSSSQIIIFISKAVVL